MHGGVEAELAPLVVEWTGERRRTPRPLLQRSLHAAFLIWGEPSTMGDVDVKLRMPIEYTEQEQMCDSKALVDRETHDDVEFELTEERLKR